MVLRNCCNGSSLFFRLRGLTQVAFFPVGTGCMFSRAWHQLRVFPRLASVQCFPALGSGCMFSRARHWLHVFARLVAVALLPVASFPAHFMFVCFTMFECLSTFGTFSMFFPPLTPVICFPAVDFPPLVKVECFPWHRNLRIV